MNKRQLKQLARHIRSIPHFPHCPHPDWEASGYQEYINYPTDTFPEHFSLLYPFAILHTKGGDITVGDTAAHALVLQKVFTGVKDDTFVSFEQLFLSFASVYHMEIALTWELLYPLVEKKQRITSEDMAITIEKCIDGARILYHLWDHIFDRCPITEAAHGGYSIEVRKQYEGFHDLPSYLKGRDYVPPSSNG